MFSQAFAKIRFLSDQTQRPEEARQAMHNLFCSNLKLVKRTQTSNLLQKLQRAGVGTNEVERFAKVCSGQNVRKGFGRRLVDQALKFKVEDANWDTRNVRRQFYVAKSSYRKTIHRNSAVDIEFRRLMKLEAEWLWSERKEHNFRKVNFLLNKWRPDQPHVNEEKVRGFRYKDCDMNAERNDRNEEVLQYGGADLNNNMIQALTLNPKMMTYSRISCFLLVFLAHGMSKKNRKNIWASSKQ